jgi:hypothetical protein
MRCRLTPEEWLLSKTHVPEDMAEREPLPPVGGNADSQGSHMENSMQALQKMKNRTTTSSRNPTTKYTSKGSKISGLKRHLHCLFTAALFSRPKRWNQPECPSTAEWIKKMWCIAFSHFNQCDRTGDHYAK